MLIKNVRNRVRDNEQIHATHPDPNISSAYWWNRDKVQTHYLESVLKDYYPQMTERYKTPIEVPPGKIVWLLHRYFKIHTRDKTPANGGWVKEEAIHEFPPSMLMKPESLE